jgi:D-alanine transaminase
MSRIAYVNGRYVEHAAAQVHIEDRGYQFADGVYEVCEVRDGYIVDLTRHLERLDRSLRELSMRWPMGRAALTCIIRETVRRNGVQDGMFYLQVTRGVAKRDHVFPQESVPSSLVITAKRTDRAAGNARAAKGISVITVSENRWDRVDIKTVGLLPNGPSESQGARSGGGLVR